MKRPCKCLCYNKFSHQENIKPMLRNFTPGTVMTAILDSMTEVGLCDLLHLAYNHGTDFLGTEQLLLPTLHLHLDIRLPILVHHLVWQELHIPLYLLVIVPPSYEALNAEDSALWIEGGLVLRGLPDEALVVGEGHPRRSDPVPLVVRDDLHPSIPVRPDT